MGKYLAIPRDEIGTREWLANHLDSFDFDIVATGDTFPDCTILDEDGRYVHAEIEFLSGNFLKHRHSPMGCEIVICWRADATLPLPILELCSGKFLQANEVSDTPMSLGEWVNRAKVHITEEFMREWQASFRDTINDFAVVVATAKLASMNPDNGKNGKQQARNESEQHQES